MPTTFERLQELFCDVFEDDKLQISRDTSTADIPSWDSVMHINLILNVEKVFGVRFSSAQVSSLRDVGEIVDFIESRKGGC